MVTMMTMKKKSRKKPETAHNTLQNGTAVTPEEDVIQFHTDGEDTLGEKNENTKRRSSQNKSKRNRYGSVPYTGIFWV